MYAFSNSTQISPDNMNELVSIQPFSILYEGTEVDTKTDGTAYEYAVADYNFAVRFTATGVTTITRLELEIATDGAGQDLTVEIRGSDFNPDGSNEGTLLKTVVVPKEFLPASAAYWQIPLNLSGLVAGTNYWIIVKKVGDATNHFHIHHNGSADASHPTYYRSGNSSGTWYEGYAIHFKAYSGTAGVPLHEISGTNGYTTLEYSAGIPSKIYFYLPPSDGAAGGVRDIMTLAYTGGILTGGSVA